MGKFNDDFSFVKRGSQFLVLTVIFLSVIALGGDQLYGIFGKNNYVTIHLMMEILIIVVTMAISIQAWLVSPYVLSKRVLYAGALFLTMSTRFT